MGAGTALGVGYYWMNQNMWRAAEMVRGSVQTLGHETVESDAKLQARIVTLESDVAKLKEAVAAAKAKKRNHPYKDRPAPKTTHARS